MTLSLPLLYFVWSEEYCQTSPNLWHVTSILVYCIFVYAYKTKTSKPQNFWIAPSKKHFSGSNDQNWMPFWNSFHIWSSKAQCEQNAWKHAMLSIVHQPLQSHIGNPCTSGQARWIITYRFVLQMTNDI